MAESNDSRSADERSQEEAPLRPVLAPLASLGPSDELRGANRRRVLAALHEPQGIGCSDDAIPWWRRQVRVPLPVAAVVLLWLAASAVLPWLRFDRSPPEPREPRVAARTETPETPGTPGTPEKRQAPDRVAVSLKGDASFFLDGGS